MTCPTTGSVASYEVAKQETPRIGILARAEDRGIGIQTWEAYRHLPGASALVVDPGNWGQGFAQHPDRFDVDPDERGSWFVRWDEYQRLPEGRCRRWLETVDVVYAVETFYDLRFIDWAREAGVATVLHTNPELHHADEAALVDEVWCATPWRMESPELAGARLVPYPVATDRFTGGRRLPVAAPRVLHVAGHAAYGDRNGTQLVAAAARYLAPPVSVWVVSQDENVPLSPNSFRFPAERDYWRLYDLGDILLMPRRFGGLCLPIQEAMAAGLAVVALDTPPHDWYGCVTVPAEVGSTFPTGTGDVEVHTADAHRIAAVVNELTGVRLIEEQERSRAWAAAHSWEALTPLWLDEFDRLVHTL